ncbi:MAG: hypothetical protein ACK476_16895 [Fluviicola sp.]
MKIIVSFFLLLLFLQSCKDKDTQTACEKAPETCQYLSEAKEYFAFKEGSWWVYEEETTHERDSVYVTSFINNASSHYFNTEILSTRDSFYTRYFPADFYEGNGCSYPGPVNKRCLYIRKIKSKFQNHLGESNIMFFKHDLGSSDYTGSGVNYCDNNKITISNILNNFSINSLNFNKTIEISEDCSHFEGDQPVKFTFSKGVGLIKKTLIDSNETWNLVSYHITS